MRFLLSPQMSSGASDMKTIGAQRLSIVTEALPDVPKPIAQIIDGYDARLSSAELIRRLLSASSVSHLPDQPVHQQYRYTRDRFTFGAFHEWAQVPPMYASLFLGHPVLAPTTAFRTTSNDQGAEAFLTAIN
jgi:hypothetical protein